MSVNKTILLFEEQNLVITQLQMVNRLGGQRDVMFGRGGQILLCGHKVISITSTEVSVSVTEETIDLTGGNILQTLFDGFLGGQIKNTLSPLTLNQKSFEYCVKSKGVNYLSIRLMEPPFPELLLSPAQVKNAKLCTIHLLKFLAGH